MQFVTKRRWRLLILGVFLAVILVSRSFLYSNFVQPIALFLWAAWRVMASVNQNVYWTLLLALGLLPLIWLIFSADGTSARTAYRQDPLPPGRVEHWEHLLAGANGSLKERERFREEWDQLLQSVRERAAFPEGDEVSGNQSGQAGSPPEVAPRLPENRFLTALPQSLQRQLVHFTKSDDRWIRESLSRMETELDISYDK